MGASRSGVRARTTAVVIAIAALTSLSHVALGQRTGVPDNAAPSLRGGWICNDGYAKRGQGCIPAAKATDVEIRDQLVARSIEAYSGSCPCPYNVDRGGRRCGARSAYSRPGGASPLCFATDVSDRMITEYRKGSR
jgi:hypothetical protein